MENEQIAPVEGENDNLPREISDCCDNRCADRDTHELFQSGGNSTEFINENYF